MFIFSYMENADKDLFICLLIQYKRTQPMQSDFLIPLKFIF